MTALAQLSLFLHDEAETIAIGQKLGTAMAKGGVIFLTGTLGAGKTTLTRGILQSFGHTGAVKSPTYTLVEPYEFTHTANGAQQVVYHFDLYRLADPEELEYMGIREYFDGQALCVVEWPNKGKGFLPKADVILTLTPENEGRALLLHAGSASGKLIIEGLAANLSA